MNPNDYLGGVNTSIAIAQIVMVAIFIRGFFLQPNLPQLQKVFLLGMALVFCFFFLDYGTIGVLRFLDNAPYPGVHHTMLPDFSQFPNGLLILSVWRTGLSLTLWALIFYLVVWKRGRVGD